MFGILMQLLLVLFGNCSPRRATGYKRAILELESLEKRLVLDAFVWTGEDWMTNLFMSNKENWKQNGGEATRAPGAGDDLTFDGTGHDPMKTIENAVVDAAFSDSVKSLTIEASYGDHLIGLSKELRVTDKLEVNGGTIQGTKNLFVGKPAPIGGGPPEPAIFTWKAGTFSGDTAGNNYVILEPGVVGTISENAEKTLSGRILQVNSEASLTWTGGKINANNNGNIEGGILVAGFAHFKTTATIEGSGDVQVYAGGVLNTDVETGEVLFAVNVVNNGSVNINQGNARLYHSRNSGTITIASGSRLFFKGDHYFDSTQGGMQSIITGTGVAVFNLGSKIHLTGNVNVGNVEDHSDVVDGAGNLQLNSHYVWVGKKWTGTGTVQVGTQTATGPGLFIGGAPGPLIGGGNMQTGHTLERKLTNYGGIWWLDKDLTVSNGGSIENKAGADFSVMTDSKIIKGAGAGTFTNAGLLQKTAGNGEAIIELDVEQHPTTGRKEQKAGKLTIKGKMTMSGGVIEVDPGTVLAFEGGFDQFDGTTTVYGTLSVVGQFLLSGGTATAVSDAALDVTGSLAQTGGSLTADFSTLTVTGDYDLDGGTATLLYSTATVGGQLQVGGHLLLNNGDVSVVGGLWVVSGGLLEAHTGSVLGDVHNAGTFRFGTASGSETFLIDGDFTQTSTGQLDVYFGTYESDLTITGHASLDGTFRGLAQAGYTPAIDDSFVLFNYGSHSGTFDNVLLPSLSEGTWAVDYADTYFEVRVVE